MGARPALRGDTFAEIADVIGEADAHRLCEHLGGGSWYVPRRISPRHPFAEVIGTAKAQALADAFVGTQLDLPKAHTRRQRAIEMAERGGLSQRDIALATDYTQRHIRNILADHRESVQDSLFGDEAQDRLPRK